MRATPVSKERLDELWHYVFEGHVSPEYFKTLDRATAFLGLDREKAPEPTTPTMQATGNGHKPKGVSCS